MKKPNILWFILCFLLRTNQISFAMNPQNNNENKETFEENMFEYSFDNQDSYLQDFELDPEFENIDQYPKNNEDEIMRQINGQQIISFCHQGDYNNLLILLENNPLNLDFIDEATGLTPLIIACRNLHENIVNYLLLKGADINFADKYGQTIIHHASELNVIHFIELALLKNVYIDCVDENGNTPLHIACLNNNLEIVKFLIAHGSNISEKNINNEHAIELTTNQKIQAFFDECSETAQEAIYQASDLIIESEQEKPGMKIKHFHTWLTRNKEKIPSFVLQAILFDLFEIYHKDTKRKKQLYPNLIILIKGISDILTGINFPCILNYDFSQFRKGFLLHRINLPFLKRKHRGRFLHRLKFGHALPYL